LQRRDSSRREQTGQNREASSCAVIPAGTAPALEALWLGSSLIRSSSTLDALMGFTPSSTAAPL
jgi:hypothetical protein